MNIDKDRLNSFLKELFDEKYGIVLRAKGIVEASDNIWLHFDMVPEEMEVREGTPNYTSVVCIIGTKLNKDAIEELIHKEFNIG